MSTFWSSSSTKSSTGSNWSVATNPEGWRKEAPHGSLSRVLLGKQDPAHNKASTWYTPDATLLTPLVWWDFCYPFFLVKLYFGCSLTLLFLHFLPSRRKEWQLHKNRSTVTVLEAALRYCKLWCLCELVAGMVGLELLLFGSGRYQHYWHTHMEAHNSHVGSSPVTRLSFKGEVPLHFHPIGQMEGSMGSLVLFHSVFLMHRN